MARDIHHLSPTPIRRPLEQRLGGMAQVLYPQEAEEPILARPVRSAVFGWLAELNAVAELKKVGIKPRASALLSGPPGCGKTTLAHHLAARLGIPMVSVGAENLLAKYLGESEANVAKLFDALESTKERCVVFLDEIDSIGSKRTDTSGDSGGAGSARNSTLTVLLRRLEQFNGILIAATNRADALDPALWRRFGMQLEVDLPDDEARFAIIKRYLSPFTLPDEAIDLLNDLTAGAAPSLLRQVMEGVKRALVLGERIRMPADDPVTTFAAIIAANRPHPDYDLPPLWDDPASVHQLAELPWPPALEGEA